MQSDYRNIYQDARRTAGLTMFLYAEIWPKRPLLKCKDCPMREGCTHEVKETKNDQK